MRLITLISRSLGWIERSLVVIMLITMVLLAFLQVILRNFFSTGIIWADPFLRHLVLWIGFIGASLATMEEKHISLDILNRFARPRTVNLARVVTNLFAGIVTALLARAGWVFLQSERETGDILLTIAQTGLPAWWFQIVIPFGFAMMSFRFLIRTLEHVGEAFSPTPTPPTPTIER